MDVCCATHKVSPSRLHNHEMNNNNNHRHGKADGGKTMQPQPYTKNSADRLLFLPWLWHRSIIEEVESSSLHMHFTYHHQHLKLFLSYHHLNHDSGMT